MYPKGVKKGVKKGVIHPFYPFSNYKGVVKGVVPEFLHEAEAALSSTTESLKQVLSARLISTTNEATVAVPHFNTPPIDIKASS